MIPSRGAWLEFEIDKRDMVGVRLDRKRKQNVTVLLKALGWDDAKILEVFGDYESMRLTLEKDHTTTQDEALLDIYRKLRPGEPPTREAAQALLENYYFNPKRYDLAKVGRYKINKKLGLELPFDKQVLTIEDIVAAIRFVVALHEGKQTLDSPRGELIVEEDDIDHFGNRRLRTVGELIQNQLRTGLGRMERVVRDRMTTQDVEAITPQTLINIRPVVAALKEFFGTSPAEPVHGPDQPGGRPDPQAAAVGAGPGWPVPRPRRHGGPRRAPQPLRPDVPDRDPGRPEHRPDRLAGLLRPGERVRLRRDALPQGGEGPGHRPDRLPDRRRGGPVRHRPGQRQARREEQVRRGAGAGPPPARRPGHGAGRVHPLHGRLAAADGLGGHGDDPVPGARRRIARPDGLQHAAPGRAADPLRGPVRGHRHGVPRCGGRR